MSGHLGGVTDIISNKAIVSEHHERNAQNETCSIGMVTSSLLRHSSHSHMFVKPSCHVHKEYNYKCFLIILV